MSAPPTPPDAPEHPVAPPAARCPVCDTPAEAGQAYCLECGQRLAPVPGLFPALGRAWRRRLPWYPGDWIWPALLGLLVATLGAAAAILATGEDGRTAPPLVATTEFTVPATGGTTTTVPEPPTTSTAPPPATTQTRPSPPRPRPPAVGAWPDRSGWTNVLESIPVSRGLPTARARARRALAAGLRRVGLLESSRYSSLHPGYYVVFNGIYSSQEEAQTALSNVRAHYPAAYTRMVVP